MNFIVLFEKIRISDIQGEKDNLCLDLCKAGKVINRDKQDANIDVKILEGELPNITEKEKVIILISSDQMMANMGKNLVAFKAEALEIFNQYGISLQKDELTVRMSAPYDIDGLIKKVRKIPVKKNEENVADDFNYEQKAKQYIPVEPLYSFDRVILPQDVLEKIEEAIGILECENKVFNEWGLYEIQPHPSTSLSFYGPSGTGKTMAAEAIAHKLGKKILKVSYADVESKYHGEGPKMVKSIFLSATNNDAVLFFDEADSLLSKRLTNVSQGSEQAINSMRSQLLICLEEFRGIVIFATNLVVNYDQAFLTRLISVEFKNPDAKTRETIWNVHIRPLNDDRTHTLNIPLSEDVDTQVLAESYDLAGREIRNAVVSACVSVAMEKREIVTQQDFVKACERIVEEKKALDEAKNHIKSQDILKMALEEKIRKHKGEEENVSELTE